MKYLHLYTPINAYDDSSLIICKAASLEDVNVLLGVSMFKLAFL